MKFISPIVTESPMLMRNKRLPYASPSKSTPMKLTIAVIAIRRSALAVHLREHLFGPVERRVRRRDAAVDRALQQDFPDLVTRDAVVDCSAHVQLELVDAVEGDHHGDRQ